MSSASATIHETVTDDSSTLDPHHHQHIDHQQQQQRNNRTLSQRQREAARLFDNIDFRHDGSLDKQELFEALRRLNLPTSRAKFDKFFATIDQDGDNVISRHEFEKFVINRYRELEEAFELLVACGEENEKARILTSARNSNNNSQKRMTIKDLRDRLVHKIKKPSNQQNNNNNNDDNNPEMISAVMCSPNIPNAPAVSKKFLTADSFRQAARLSGVQLSDQDLSRIISHLDAAGDDRVSFEEFVDALMLCPFEVNPQAFFDTWFTDAFVDDNDYTIPREIRLPSSSSSSSSSLPHAPMIPPSQQDGEEGGGEASLTPAVAVTTTTTNAGVVSAPTTATTSTTTATTSTSTQQPPTFAQMAAKKLLLGGFAGFLSRSLTAPIDRVRILMMTNPHRISVSTAISQSVSDGGARALWKGNAVNCIKVTPEMAIKLFVFDMLKKSLAKDPSNITFTERLLSGSVAGFLSQSCVYPLEVVRTRMAVGAPVGEKPYLGIADCIKRTFHEGATREINPQGSSKNTSEDKSTAKRTATGRKAAAKTTLTSRRSSLLGGVKIFYSGLPASACGILPFAGIDLSLNSYFRDMASDHLKKQGREVSIPLLLSCGMASSTIATIFTFPLNVIRTKAQHTGEPVMKISRYIFTHLDHKTGLKPTPFTIFKRLYVGTLPAVAKIGPATAISYASYEWMQRKF